LYSHGQECWALSSVIAEIPSSENCITGLYKNELGEAKSLQVFSVVDFAPAARFPVEHEAFHISSVEWSGVLIGVRPVGSNPHWSCTAPDTDLEQRIAGCLLQPPMAGTER